jgi:hypothetical protein
MGGNPLGHYPDFITPNAEVKKKNDLYAASNRQAHAAEPHYSTP